MNHFLNLLLDVDINLSLFYSILPFHNFCLKLYAFFGYVM